MAKNELLPFADGEDANVLPTNQWEALTDILENGFQSGIAKSEQVNRVLAQGAVASYVLGQLIVDQLNKDATLDKDTLYQNIVQALQENAKDACLPLSGGTVTGNVYFGSSISQTKDSAIFDITGGTAYNKGAYLSLSGKDSSRGGRFDLVAHNGTNYKNLVGTASGALTWGGTNIVRSVNGASANTNGEVTISVPSPKAYVTETYRSGSTWYRKWSDGFIEQGGICTGNPSVTVTFPVAFTTVTLHVNINGYTGTANNPEQFKLDGKPSLTAFWAKGVYSTSNAQGTISSLTGYWDACGY